MIGTRSEAREILPYLKGTSRRKPTGWKCLRSRRTCCRRVYLSPRGVVYKVDTDGYNGFQPTNEVETYRRRATLPRGWKFPETRLLDVDGVAVIAQRFVEGVHPESWSEDEASWETANAFASIGIEDDHAYNWMIDARGVKWIVDGGV